MIHDPRALLGGFWRLGPTEPQQRHNIAGACSSCQAGRKPLQGMAPQKPQQLIDGPGLLPLLDTDDFGGWEAVAGNALGHHRSRLLPGAVPFEARMRSGMVEEFPVLEVQGRGQVELQREQCGHGVLRLSLQGLSHELINGEDHLAEPASALLFQEGLQ